MQGQATLTASLPSKNRQGGINFNLWGNNWRKGINKTCILSSVSVTEAYFRVFKKINKTAK